MLQFIQEDGFSQAAVAFLVIFVFMSALITLVLRIDRSRKRDVFIKAIRAKGADQSQRAAQAIRSRERAVLDESNRARQHRADIVSPSAIRLDMRRAGLPGQPLLLILATGVLAWLVGMFVLAAPIFPIWAQALAVFPVCFFLLRVNILQMMIESRRLVMMEQLIAFIEHVQRSVTVGSSPDVAVAEAIAEVDKPLSESLGAIKELLDLGYDFVEAINLAADRVDLPEFDIFAASLVAQATSGGAVGDVLREVTQIARMRVDLQKKVATLTGEGRFNAILLGSLPIGLSIYLRAAQPDYFQNLWNGNPLGPIIYFTTLFSAVFGAYVAMRLAKIKI